MMIMIIHFLQIDVFGRPDLMDPAVLRPGRFGKHMYVPLSNKDERGFILKALASNKPMDSSVNLSEIGQRTACEKFTRADLAALLGLYLNTYVMLFII